MKKKHLFVAALFLAALAFGFVGCENPDSESGISIEKPGDDSTSDKPNDSEDGNTKPTTPEVPTMVATGGASDVEYSTVTLWGRINTDTLWAFSNIKWGIECSTSKEEMQSHKGKKVLCTTDLVGENSDEYAVAFTELEGGKMLYYNAYLVINDMKYIYGEVDSVHLDVKLTLCKKNNTDNYNGDITVTGSGTYDYGAEATITAEDGSYYYFTSWSDCDSKELSRTITLTSDSTITANCKKKLHLFIDVINYEYGGRGNVTGSGYYKPGDEVTIIATYSDYYCYADWDDCDSNEQTRTVTLTSDSTITATFLKKVKLTLYVNDSNCGTVSGKEYCIPGIEETISATPKLGCEFVKWSDGNTDNPRIITISSNKTLTAIFKGDTNGKAYVDLGLPSGLKWATCNVGATTPEGYGNYYAWGETTTKSSYAESNYTYSDSPTILPLNKDAASVNMGGSWRMPTKAEQDELRTECSWTWTTLNGVNGYNVEGPNGNSIFLPAAGYRINSALSDAGSSGDYWSSSRYTDFSTNAYLLRFSSDDVRWDYSRRYCGQSVRGVCP